MPSTELFNNGTHRNILLEDFGHGLAVQANQHLIVHNGCAMLLDPGGHKVYSKSRGEVDVVARATGAKLTDLFISHQDPDICAALNGWLMTSDAMAHVPTVWARFITHFGVDKLVSERIVPIDDAGRWLDLGGCQLALIPAHFLHSCGNFQVYDPTSKILYSGDLGASLGIDYFIVPDFEAHLPSMEGFHRRYMPSNVALRAWAKMARGMDIETIAPQHGAVFKGKEMVGKFIDWIETLETGLDIMTGNLQLPPKD